MLILNLFAMILIVSGIVLALGLMAYAFNHPREVINATRNLLRWTNKKIKKVESRRCEYCGSLLSEDLSSCPNCGAPVREVMKRV